MNNQERVLQFYMEKRGSIPTPHEARVFDSEECSEVQCALNGPFDSPGFAHIAKELADRMFTGYGIAISLGIDLDRAFDLVCQSNMTKERTPDGKVKKGPDYVEPDMSSCLMEMPK